MRISDWSSDVCSSDLYVRFDRNDVVPGYVYQFMRSRYEELQSVGRAGGSTKAALTCAFLRDYRLPLPAKVEQHDIAAAIATIDRKLARSEEHTSELQSLMRISSAVSCVKKKKKTKTQPMDK